jgi:hypothetical protein
MLSRSFTAVIERNVTFDDVFTTEPYETAWAVEARWFVHVLDASPGASIEIASEVSPEGITWCPHEARPVGLQGRGLVTLALTQVGPWQRLKGCVTGPDAQVKVIVYLTLRG